MKYKVLKLNEDNMAVFTKEELEVLLEEVYEEGKKDGYSMIFYPDFSSKTITDSDSDQLDWDNVFNMIEE